MHTLDLTDPQIIRHEYETGFLPREAEWRDWKTKYVEAIKSVRSATTAEMVTPAFQHELWEVEKISGTGLCTIPMTDAVQSHELAEWIASLRDRELPPPGPQRIEALKEVHDELVARAKPFSKRTPWLKFMRLLAAIFPRDISCVVVKEKLLTLTTEMYGKLPRGQRDMISMNALVYERIDEAVGAPDHSAESLALRSMFAWHLYQGLVSQEESDGGEVEGPRPGESQLDFLPYERRTKSIQAMSGYVNTALKVLDFVQNGATVQETIEYFHQEQPGLKDVSVKSHLSTIRHVLGLLQLDGHTLKPSALGQRLLDSADPTILIPRVLTRVIGFDLLLYVLNESSPREKSELVKELRDHLNWKSNFGPTSLLRWAEHFGMVEQDESKNYSLTETGQEWAEQVRTRPERVVIDEDEAEQLADASDPQKTDTFQPPTLEEILERFENLPYVFPREIIARMHVALHMHPSKHFVLLSGLSGTGKTKLAELYANAYHRVADTNDNKFFKLIPVQPDWTDPTGLLGYVNPLQETVTYAGTDFLRFLNSAVRSPQQPHFVCLDEMNLARVEYYFAPLLSAMETAQPIVIHQNDGPVDAVEPSIPWPSNLFIIGTVNMDETTHAFSDKVLDRAFTLEFWDVDLNEFGKRYADRHSDYPNDLMSFAIEQLGELQAVLEPAHLHFGYRTAEEILAFLGTNHRDGANVLTREAALDHAVLMKALPKIRGQDSPEFRTCLEDLTQFLASNGCTASAAKAAAMRRDLELTGTTRFWR